MGDVAIVDEIAARSASCDIPSSGSSDSLEATASGQSELRYDTQQEQFVFNWQTPKSPTTKCFEFVVRFRDGEAHTANFRLRP